MSTNALTPSLIEVWDSRLGIHEVKGSKHNDIILQWWRDAGHAEIIDDETAWCSGAMCSAAKEAGLPFPPVNVNPMARSWLTMGVSVRLEDVQPGDVVVWPRGKPNSGQGHVNMVREVRRVGAGIEVRCIGGNQSHKSGGAVTLTDWTDLKGALPNGIRRLVPATVKDLRNAGSTTIKQADNLEKVGIIATFFTPIFEGIRHVFGPVEVPKFATLPEGLSWWRTLLNEANGVLDYATAHPILAATVIAGLGAWTISRINKASRVAEHAAGIPIAAEVRALVGG